MVMLASADNVAEARPITVERTVGDKWLVSAGLKPGDRVIMEGLQQVQRARPGTTVVYRFTGPLEEIYCTLVVRLHYSGLFSRTTLYRQAADFATATGKLAALTMLESGERGELDVYFGDKLDPDVQAAFQQFVHDHLKFKAKDVERLRNYFCLKPKCGKESLDRSAIDAGRLLRPGSLVVLVLDLSGGSQEVDRALVAEADLVLGNKADLPGKSGPVRVGCDARLSCSSQDGGAIRRVVGELLREVRGLPAAGAVGGIAALEPWQFAALAALQ